MAKKPCAFDDRAMFRVARILFRNPKKFCRHCGKELKDTWPLIICLECIRLEEERAHIRQTLDPRVSN